MYDRRMTIRKQGARVGFIRIPVSVKVVGGSDVSYDAAFLVDTGATDSMPPASQLHRVGIKPVGKLAYELAHGRHVQYEFGLAQIEFMGDITAGRVIFGPEDAEPLLGVTQLESAGIVIDPRTGNLKRLPAIPLKQLAATV
jgi:clan AA aspartic protease